MYVCICLANCSANSISPFKVDILQYNNKQNVCGLKFEGARSNSLPNLVNFPATYIYGICYTMYMLSYLVLHHNSIS